MNRAHPVGASLLLWLLVPCAADAGDTWYRPYPGVRYLRRVTSAPRRIHVLKVDLHRADLRVRATRDRDRNLTTSRFARRYGCVLAVNGDFFRLADRHPSGLAMGAHEVWRGTADSRREGFVAFGAGGRAVLSPPQEVVAVPPSWASQIVSGRPLIVEQGRALSPTDCAPHFCARHPRTAVGLSRDRHTLILAVVDGRSSKSIGMTTRELGALMVQMGAWRALNLDGGGSSAMYVKQRGGVVNAPSDGTERRVANHIGIARVRPTTAATTTTSVDTRAAPELSGSSEPTGAWGSIDTPARDEGARVAITFGGGADGTPVEPPFDAFPELGGCGAAGAAGTDLAWVVVLVALGLRRKRCLRALR